MTSEAAAPAEKRKQEPGDDDGPSGPQESAPQDGELALMEQRVSAMMEEALHDGVITFDEADSIAQDLRMLRRRILLDNLVDRSEEAVLACIRQRTRELLLADWTME